MLKINKTIDRILKEFDEKFVIDGEYEPILDTHPENIKDFLRSSLSKAIQQDRQEMREDKDIARQCLEFKGVGCKKRDCKNIACPLNKDILTILEK